MFIGKSDPPSYMKKFWGSFSVVSGATMCSRVLGLIRDILFFATFGASMFGEAFLSPLHFPIYSGECLARAHLALLLYLYFQVLGMSQASAGLGIY